MSVKTPVFKFDVPVLGEEANVPTDLLSLATEIENAMKALDPKFLKTAGAGDVKKLLIVNATGEPVVRALSGDATISETGVITIANEAVNAAKILALAVTEAKLAGESVATAKIKLLAVTAATLAEEAVSTIKIANLAVTEAKLAGEAVAEAKIKNLAVATGKLAELAVTTAKIAALAVTEGKIADAAVTSRKWKPTWGEQIDNEAKVIGAEFLFLPGTKLEVTPLVASFIEINAAFQVGIAAVAERQGIECSIFVDGVAKRNAQVTLLGAAGGVQTIPLAVNLNIALTAALHTIELKAKRIVGANGGIEVAGTGYTWQLGAS